jgi:predicted Kef-type K+ transport protein
MRKLSPERRRAAAICGACAAIIPSISLAMRGSHSNAFDFAGGLIIGLAMTLSIATVIRTRRACS